MKTLVDTCVWSLALRRKSSSQLSTEEKWLVQELREAIEGRRVAIIGPIRQEVLSGIRDGEQFSKIQELLGAFRDESIIEDDYVEAANLFSRCRDAGVECGPVDILVCAVAARLRCSVLTSDKGLKRCLEVLR